MLTRSRKSAPAQLELKSNTDDLTDETSDGSDTDTATTANLCAGCGRTLASPRNLRNHRLKCPHQAAGGNVLTLAELDKLGEDAKRRLKLILESSKRCSFKPRNFLTARQAVAWFSAVIEFYSAGYFETPSHLLATIRATCLITADKLSDTNLKHMKTLAGVARGLGGTSLMSMITDDNIRKQVSVRFMRCHVCHVVERQLGPVLPAPVCDHRCMHL
jgi:hypothetical protein